MWASPEVPGRSNVPARARNALLVMRNTPVLTAHTVLRPLFLSPGSRAVANYLPLRLLSSGVMDQKLDFPPWLSHGTHKSLLAEPPRVIGCHPQVLGQQGVLTLKSVLKGV